MKETRNTEDAGWKLAVGNNVGVEASIGNGVDLEAAVAKFLGGSGTKTFQSGTIGNVLAADGRFVIAVSDPLMATPM